LKRNNFCYFFSVLGGKGYLILAIREGNFTGAGIETACMPQYTIKSLIKIQNCKGYPGYIRQVFMNNNDPKAQGAPQEPQHQELFR
jgi:hypothetical protein